MRGALRNYSADHCSVESVIERAGVYTTPKLLKASHWLDDLLDSGQVKIVWRQSNQVDRKGEFTYQRNGHKFFVWWDNFLAPDAPVRRRLVIHACLFVPRKLEIFDTDVRSGGKTARVIFMPDITYSWIGRQLFKLRLLTGNNTFPTAQGTAHVGWLSEAQDGDWKVNGVD